MNLNQNWGAGIQIKPGSLDFGNVTVGQSGAKRVTISNPLSKAVTISKISVNGSGFTLKGLPALPFLLGAGKSLSVEAIFSPNAAGSASGTLSISGDSSGGTVSKASLAGNGQAASSSASSTHLAGLGCSSSSITGGGSDQCTVTLSSAAGSDGFSLALSSSSSAFTVPPTIKVQEGASSASFTAQAASVNLNQKVILSATGGPVTTTFAITLYAAEPALTLSPSSVSFGGVSTGSSASQSVTVTSNGTSALTINSASISGTGFSVSGASFPLNLNPGSSIDLQVKFTPSSSGTFSGTLSFSTNLPGSSKSTVSLSGTGQVGGTQSGTYHVQLAWSAPATSTDPVVGYDIYRQISGSSSYALLNPSLNSATTYADSTVSSGVKYNYYVTSVDSAGNQSSPSNIFTVSVP